MINALLETVSVETLATIAGFIGLAYTYKAKVDQLEKRMDMMDKRIDTRDEKIDNSLVKITDNMHLMSVEMAKISTYLEGKKKSGA